MSTDWIFEIQGYLLESDIISSKKYFCEMYLGKNESYLRQVQLGKQPISADTAAYLSEALKYKANTVSSTEATVLHDFANRCYMYIQEKAKEDFKPVRTMELQ